MAVVGIDLGTTYSVVAHLNELKKPEIIPPREGGNTTASVVYFESEANKVVGEHAKNAAESDPELIVQFVKNQMGNNKSWTFYGQEYRPEDISAIILKKLVESSEQALGTSITGAVITVPAIFGDAQRNATVSAAKIAGLDVIGILDEPVAAAIAYGLIRQNPEESRDSRLLVFDLGGGTFDVSVMEVSGVDIRMLYTGGDRMLGGKLWDDVLVDYIANEFINEFESDPRENIDTYQSLRMIAEIAKKTLSDLEKTVVRCDHQGHSLKRELTRSSFDELTNHLCKRAETITQFCIDELVMQKVISGWDDINEIILVGGSSRLLQIQAMLSSLTGKKPQLYDPDLAVANGAALFSEMELVRSFKEHGDSALLTRHGIQEEDLALLPTNASVKPVCSFGLGVKMGDGNKNFYNNILIQPNSPLPARGNIVGYTAIANQSEVAIEVFEGDCDDLDLCTFIGSGIIKEIPPGLPASSPVDVTFELTEESAIHVVAVETTHGTNCNFTLTREGGMSESSIRQNQARLSDSIIQ